MDAFALVVGSRMIVTALVVVAASLAVERSGPLLASLIATLPLSAGPAWAFLAIDHEPAFVAAGAVTSLVAVGANAAFVVVYVALAARDRGTAVSLGAALAASLAAMALSSLRTWTLGEAAIATLAAQGLGLLLTRGQRGRAAGPFPPPRAWHLAVRAGAVMLVVLTVVLAGRYLGPLAAGYAALLPVVFTGLVLVLQPIVGGRAMAPVLANSLLGMMGYVPALALLNLLAVPLGSAAALLVALGACVVWNATLLVIARSGRRIIRR